MSPSCCRHVSFLCKSVLFLCCPPLFLMQLMLHGAGGTGGLPPSRESVLFLCCPPLFLMLHGAGGTGVSLHLHVSIPSSTRFFFYANLSFSYAAPLFFLCNLCSMAQVGRGVSLHLHVSILLSTRFFFYANGAGGTGGLPPSPCLYPVVDTFFCFLMLICPFLMLPPSFSYAAYAPWRRWDRGSPSIAMSPSCCRHVSFLCKSVLFLCCPPLFLMQLMLHGAGGTGGLPPSPCLHPVVDTFLF